MSSPAWIVLEDVLQRALAARAARVLLLLEALLALVRELAGAAVVLDGADVLAGLGDPVEAEHLDRIARVGLLDALAGEVVERADAAPVGARDERVADAQRAALDEDRHDRAAARVELGLDDDAGGRRGRVGLELLELGDDLQRVEQVLEADLRLRRHVDELRLAAPLDGLQPARGHLGAHAGRVRALLVDLVDRDDDRHVGGLRVVDRLVGLRLDAVVGGHDDDGDVRHAGAAGAHRGEGLVAGRVEERHELAVVVHLVGADVLRDAAGLAGDDLRRADRVQQRRLAVVDVAHDRDDRRAVDEILLGVLEDRARTRPRRRRGRSRPPCRTPRRGRRPPRRTASA